jgi:hypothetical protein
VLSSMLRLPKLKSIAIIGTTRRSPLWTSWRIDRFGSSLAGATRVNSLKSETLPFLGVENGVVLLLSLNELVAPEFVYFASSWGKDVILSFSVKSWLKEVALLSAVTPEFSSLTMDLVSSCEEYFVAAWLEEFSCF